MSNEDLTIEPMLDGSGDYGVYRHGTYGRSSVLAGQPKRTYVESGSLEEMKESYPEAQVLDGSTKHTPVMSPVPPDWFDEANAGETW